MIEFDRSILEQEYDFGVVEVDEDSLVAYAKSLGYTDPLYVDPAAARQSEYGGIIAAPTAYACLKVRQNWQELDVRLGTQGVLAGGSCELFAPMRPGDTISAKGRYVDIYEKTGRSGKMVFVVQETTYTNQHGEVVAKARNTMMRR